VLWSVSRVKICESQISPISSIDVAEWPINQIKLPTSDLPSSATLPLGVFCRMLNSTSEKREFAPGRLIQTNIRPWVELCSRDTDSLVKKNKKEKRKKNREQ
jgi:hypothetical protein